MKTVLLKAVSGDIEIICLRLKSLYVCVEMQQHVPHLLYGFAEEWPAELKRKGYTVTETKVDIPILEEELNELSFTCHANGHIAVYLFGGLAVKADGWEGLDFFCKAEPTIADAKEHWGESIPDETDGEWILSVPNDALGALAVKLEQISYDCWDQVMRAPGEIMTVDARLDNLKNAYEMLGPGPTLLDVLMQYRVLMEGDISELKCVLEDYPAEKESDRGFYKQRIETDRELLERINTLEATLGFHLGHRPVKGEI